MDPVFLNCQISQGAFSGERVFEVNQLDGVKYIGLSPRHYCYHRVGDVLKATEPQPGVSIDGRIAARRIGIMKEGARVAIPDGRAISVPAELITDRTLGEPHVPI